MATRALQQVITYLAWNTSTNAYVTGDSANHSLSWCKDGTRSAATNAAAEVDSTNMPGLYKCTMTSTETDCIEGTLGGKSSTGNVVLIPTMVAFDYLNTSAPAAAGIPDVNVKNINNVTAATPGASGGVLISGSNSGTTTFGALTVTGVTTLTGNVVLSDGLTISAPSTTNRAGLDIAGNGTGQGIKAVGGATGAGVRFAGGASSGDGLDIVGGASSVGVSISVLSGNGKGMTITGTGTQPGLYIAAGTVGNGITVIGGSSSGDGINVTTTSGNGISVTATGTSMHGVIITGGNGGTSDGLKLVNGTGGVGLRSSDITVTNNTTLSGAVSLGSTLGVTGTTTFAAIATGTITTTGNLSISGTTTLTGAVTANNAGNAITGVTSVLTSAYDYAKGTVAMTESYAANGVAPTPVQATFAIHQLLMDFAVTGTSYTVRKLDNIATAFVGTLDDATNPTSLVRT